MWNIQISQHLPVAGMTFFIGNQPILYACVHTGTVVCKKKQLPSKRTGANQVCIRVALGGVQNRPMVLFSLQHVIQHMMPTIQ